MHHTVFRCPVTNMHVHHRLDDREHAPAENTYDTVKCPACARVHFINKTTGKLLGDK